MNRGSIFHGNKSYYNGERNSSSVGVCLEQDLW